MGIINKIASVFKTKENKQKGGERMIKTFDINRYNKRLEENSVWYSGIDTELRRYYLNYAPSANRSGYSSDESNYFWTRNSEETNVRAIHSGIPQLISEKMVDLLVGNGFSIRANIKGIVEDKETQERLDLILKDNKFNQLIQEAIETESWSGGVAFKLTLHKRFKLPVIEVIQPENYEPVIVAGRIVEDIFKVFYSVDNKEYKLHEIYGADESGAYIKYKLFVKNPTLDSTWTEISLNKLTATKDLKDYHIPGIKNKLSIYKPNKLPNSEFRGSKLGESDYSGSYGAFDGIDEILSTWIQEFRDGKISKFWPENLLPIDENSKTTLPNQLKKDFIMFNPGISQQAQSQTTPLILQAELNTDKHETSLKKWMELVLNNAGLSPVTIGVTGLESTAASESSQIMREKTSIRTRNKKLELWTEALTEFIPVILQLDDFKRGNEIKEYETVVDFEDYDLKTTMDKTQEAAIGLQSKSWDIKSAVDYVHTDLSNEEKVLMRVNIKIENGIDVFTKEEELVYRKYIMELETEAEQQPESEIIEPEVEIEEITEPEPAPEDAQDPLEDILTEE